MVAVAGSADAAALRLVTYNTFGLPPIQGFVPDRTAEFTAMAPLLEDIHGDGTPTLLALEEVFHPPYFNFLTDPNTVTYPEITSKDNGGPNGIGDGLTLMSDLTIASFSRVGWTDCFGSGGFAGSDCDTNKGFMFARVEIAPGIELDFYTLHADAGQDANSRAARIANLGQLAAAIGANSFGRAVIVLGDTNSLYTRSTDAIGAFATALGLQDAWVEQALGGSTPGFGAVNNSGCPAPRGSATGSAIDASGSTCEVVDKILFRSGGQLQLTLMDYEVLLNLVDGSGNPLSDHLPVTAMFDLQVVPEPALALLLVASGAALGARRARARASRAGGAPAAHES
jgi:hypothetical protein